MTATPTVSWSKVGIPPTAAMNTGWAWWPTTPGDTPPPITLQHGVQQLECLVATIGAVELAFTGNIVQGSIQVTNVNLASGYLYGGMPIQGACIPNDTTILDVSGGLLLDLSAKAVSSGTNAPFKAQDVAPNGYLTASVTPTTGVTMADYNFDGGRINPMTNTGALQMWNYSSQAEALCYIGFANPGSYSVSVGFTSLDSNYGNATVPTPLAVTVT